MVLGETPRKTGIEAVGDVGWGTHFCMFYRTKEDLLDILVPYFKAGLENNEFCMWVAADPLNATEAYAALQKAVPGFSRYVQNGQILILPHTEWYLKDGVFESQRVLNGWVEKLEAGLAKGFAGLRLTGNTFWLEKKDWHGFTGYEAAVNGVIGKYNIVALCTYSLEKCNAVEIIDVIRNHEFALICNEGNWELIENAIYKQAREALAESESLNRKLFHSMLEGFALHDVILDDAGRPYDYRFVDVNKAYEEQTGRMRDEVVGRTVREIIPAPEQRWLDTYHKAVLTGEAATFENYSARLCKWFETRVYAPNKMQLAATFRDITERKRSEAVLRASEQRYRNLFESMDEGFALCEMVYDASGKAVDFRYLEVNPAFERQTGLTAEYAVGKTVREIIPGIESFWIETYDRIVRTGISERIDNPVAELNKHFELFAWRAAPGQFGVVFVDVTERKQAEAALKRDEARLETLFEISNYDSGSIKELLDFALEKAISLTDSRIGYVYRYDEQNRMFTLNSWSREVMQDCTVANRQTTYELDKTGIWGEAVRQRKPFILNDFQAHHPLKKGYPDGHSELRRFLTVPVMTDDKIVAVVGVANKGKAYDQTDIWQITLLMNTVWKIVMRKEAEEALRESEGELSATLASVPMLMLVVDPERHVLKANKAAGLFADRIDEAMLGLRAGNALRCLHSFDDPRGCGFGPSCGICKTKQSIDDTFATGNSHYQVEWHLPFVGKEEEVTFLLSTVLLPTPKKQALLCIEDITERKRAERDIEVLNQDLRRRATELEASNKELESFSYSVSHDLRAPLRSLDGFSQALLEDYAAVLDENGKDFLNRIRKSSQLMGHLIDDMLTLSRVTRTEIAIENVNLSQIATAVAVELKQTQPDRDVQIDIRQNVEVHGDAHLLRMVMENLLGNAWKFTSRREHARIEFGVAVVNGESACYVRDNGAGFNMQYAHKLFTPFQRLHSVTEFAGTGIGLATVQRVIHRLGGKVWAEGEPDKGATFYFTLKA